MRLIGGKDYYDSALAFGQDKEIVFVRPKESYRKNDKSFHNFDCHFLARIDGKDGNLPSHMRSYNHDRWRYNFMMAGGLIFYFIPVEVYFCGKRYGGFRMQQHDPQYRLSLEDAKKRATYIWNVETLESILENAGYYLDDKSYGRRDVEPHFTHQPKTLDWLVKNRITIATYNPNQNPYHDGGIGYIRTDQREKWRLDGDDLGTMQFAKVMPPYQAMQELSMWVGSTLPRPGPEMVTITDDKVKLTKHGMDKWSFRKKGVKSS